MLALIAAALFWFYWFLGIYLFMVLLRVAIAWILPGNPLLIWLVPVTNPGLGMLKLIPLDLTYRGFDFSPGIALVALIFIRKFLKRLVNRYY